MNALILLFSFVLSLMVQKTFCASLYQTTTSRFFSSLGAANRDAINQNPHFIVKNRDRLSFLKTEFGYATCENRRGKNQKAAYPNQDRAFAGTILGKEFFVICDGHGTHGDKIAAEVINALPEKVLGAKDSGQGFITACTSLQKLFASVAYAQHSGTTMVGAVIKEKKLIVGNVGDSRLILVRGGCVVGQTQDHSIKNNAERQRIKAAGGTIINGYAYGKNTHHGLALTRSLGDVVSHDGQVISAQPDITEYLLQDGDYVILASDGYWDVVNNNETAQLLNNIQSLSATSLAEKLVSIAKDRASRDDITVLVICYREQQK